MRKPFVSPRQENTPEYVQWLSLLRQEWPPTILIFAWHELAKQNVQKQLSSSRVNPFIEKAGGGNGGALRMS